ncbi:SsrA-binding protein [Candidatus Parcubacteria bacterium]|nr:MAG: SsrA-binding protein [Candidatus Parcubacteria bacterium]
MPVLAINKRAKFDYEIISSHEAGVVLFGHEVKSIKTRKPSMKGSFVTIKSSGKNAELFLTNCHISLYDKTTTVENYNPERPRKLLMHRKEIDKLIGKKQEQGLTLVPIKIYTKGNLIKLEFGVGRGKKKHDKREDIKKRDTDRQIRRVMKERR